jgi:hypothetical protein
MIYDHKQFDWKPIDPISSARLEKFRDMWQGTPWSQGQRARKIGADCVQLSMACLDFMFRSEPTHVPCLPARVAINRPDQALPTILAFKNSHYGFDTVDDMTIQPGDVVVLRAEVQQSAALLEGHVVIALPSRYTVLSTTKSSRAQQVTLASFTGILSVYRPREKFRWASPH